VAASLRIAVVAVLLFAAACAPRREAQQAPPPVPTQSQASSQWIGRDVIQAACLNDLQASGAKFELIAQAETGKDGCTLQNGVRLISTSVELVRPVELTCPMAVRLMEFERDVLKPLALGTFGKPLRRLNHAGGFTCKRMTGNGSRISEHGHGRAIDIWGFSLMDETRISIDRQWRSRDAFGNYLREVARKSCDYFSVVLTPNSDAAHGAHFHWDIGQWKRCGL